MRSLSSSPAAPVPGVSWAAGVARAAGAALAATVALAGCSADDATAGQGHSHGTGAAMVSLPVGDGTAPSDVGYTLTDVDLDAEPGRPGTLSFRLEDHTGTPVTDYVTELTRDLHLYVVSEDLAVFRHLHPEMDPDGTWSVDLTLPVGGDYRVITEFVAVDDGGNGDHLILGAPATVPTSPTQVRVGATDPTVTVDVLEAPRTGPDGRLELRLRDREGRPVRLGTYLGTYAHVTGFHRSSGAVVHTHPLTDPEVTEDGSSMTFHTEIDEAGTYRMFVQVRVDGFLHTVPVEVDVSGR